jgi:hypothetical protein|nr:MAG TPA: biofilm formation stimulator [Caudoviricetes sp.]
MIEITKAEAKEIRKVYPNVFIAKTRHKRFIEESVKYLELIPFNIEAREIVEQARRNARY